MGIIRVPVSFLVFPDEPARTWRKVLEQQSRLRDRTRGRHAVCRPAFRLHPAPDARADCVSRPTRRPRRELFLPRAFSFSWPGPILFCSPPGGGRSPKLGFIPYAAMSETSSNCWKTITPAGKQVRLSSLIYNAFLSCRGNGVINEAGCWDYLVGMTSGAIHVAQVPESGWPCPLPPPLGCNLSTNRKRKPKWRRCVAASIAVGPSAILTGSRTRPSDCGSNARFGPVEDRRNNRRLATVTCTLCTTNLKNFVRCTRISNPFSSDVFRSEFTPRRSVSPPQRPAPPGSP